MWLVNRDVRISKVAGQAAVTYTAVRLRSHYADFQRRETKGRSRQLQLPSLVIFTFYGLYAATFRHIPPHITIRDEGANEEKEILVENSWQKEPAEIQSDTRRAFFPRSFLFTRDQRGNSQY